MGDERRDLDALMFKPSKKPDGPPEFRTVDERRVNYYRWLGWYLLAKESDVRYADVEDVRKEDESRGRRE
jgi:hypothetical protein